MLPVHIDPQRSDEIVIAVMNRNKKKLMTLMGAAQLLKMPQKHSSGG